MQPPHRRSTTATTVLAVLMVTGCAGTSSDPTATAPAPTSTTTAPTTSNGPSIPSWPAPTQDLPPVDTDAAPRGIPDVANVDNTDPVEVARIYVQLLFTSDTVTDTAPLTAAQRAAVLQADPAPRGASATADEPPQWWRTLAASNGYTTVATEALPELELPDNSYRLVSVPATTTYRGADLEPTTFTVDVVLIDTDGQWRVDTIRTRTSEGSP